MIKAVLDANIFVSAIIKAPSNPARILDLVKERKVTLVLSNEILSEVRTALLYPRLQKLHHRSPKEIDQFFKDAVRISFRVSGKIKINAIKEDPKDNKYLSAAVEGKADFIVSGDYHLKDLKTFQGIRILDPGTFLGLVKTLTKSP